MFVRHPKSPQAELLSVGSSSQSLRCVILFGVCTLRCSRDTNSWN
jgi:hypothetical protein